MPNNKQIIWSALATFTLFLMPAISNAAKPKIYGSEKIYNIYADTFGRYISSNGQLKKFPILSQTERGYNYRDDRSLYNYVGRVKRGGVKESLGNACGPMSLLMLKNYKYRTYDWYKNNDAIVKDVSYIRRGIVPGDVNTTIRQLKLMAEKMRFAFSKHDEDLDHEKTHNGGLEFKNNAKSRIAAFNAIKHELAKGRKAIILLHENASISTVEGYNHFNIVYQIKEYASTFMYGGIKTKRAYVYLLDPWTGTRRVEELRDVLDSLDLTEKWDYLIVNV